MRAISDTFRAALLGSVQTTARVRVCSPFYRDGLQNLTAGGPGLPVLSGQVVIDGTADLRMRVEGLTVAPYWPDRGQDVPNAAGLFPTRSGAGSGPARTAPGQPIWPARRAPSPYAYAWELSPHGNLLQIDVGLELGGGSLEYVRLGYVRIDEIRQPDAPDGPIEVECSDLNAFLVDARPEFEFTFPAGTTYEAIVKGLVDTYAGRSGATWVVAVNDFDIEPGFAARTIPTARTTEGDRYGFLNDLVTSAGYVWYWDGRGKLKITPAPDSSAAPVWDIAANGTGTRIGRTITRDGVTNILVVDGEPVGDVAPPRAVRYNGFDQDSYWYTFGKATRFYSSPLLTTDTQVQAAAETIARTNPGVPYRLEAEHVACAALEPGDVVRVWPYGTEDPLSFERHIVEVTTIPLLEGTGRTAMREVTS